MCNHSPHRELHSLYAECRQNQAKLAALSECAVQLLDSAAQHNLSASRFLHDLQRSAASAPEHPQIRRKMTDSQVGR